MIAMSELHEFASNNNIKKEEDSFECEETKVTINYNIKEEDYFENDKNPRTNYNIKEDPFEIEDNPETNSNLDEGDPLENDEIPSTTNSNLEEEEEEPIKRKRKQYRKHKIWLKNREFPTAESATNHVHNLNTWRKISAYTGAAGHKILYRCTAGKYRKNECPAQMYLLFHSENSRVSLYVTKDEHDNHVEIDRGLPKQTRELVNKLFEDGIRRPNAIIFELQNRGIREPQKLKLKNYLAKLRQQKLGQSTVSITDILSWCNDRMEVPAADDTPFVLGVKVDDEEQDLKMVISTKRLLRLVDKSEGVQTDATYKLNWQGYPVLIVGTSDIKQTFHPFVIAVCINDTELDFAYIFQCVKDSVLKIFGTEWNPNVLLADASSAITNGFEAVFGVSFRRLMCYSHIIQSVDEKLRGTSHKEQLKNDIDCLHLCPDDNTFDIVSKLFVSKWMETNNDSITDFLEYFKSLWLTCNRYWYIGATTYFPCTNNGLDAANTAIKRENAFRERLPVAQFLEVLEEAIVRKWSHERDPVNPNFKPFHVKQEFSTKIWKDAYKWAQLDSKILKEIHDGNKSIFYFASSGVTSRYPDISIEKIRSFDSYKKEYRNLIWRVTVTCDSNFTVSTCSCLDFVKKFVCRHSVGMLIRMGKTKVPTEVKHVPLGQKRKRGRPTKDKNKKALLVQ